jgi:hypothetical protein
MPKTKVLRVRTVAILLLVSLLTTVGSYPIVTGKNLPLNSTKDYKTITGDDIVTLPCAPVGDSDWDSGAPVLPETRGIPFNYHYWDPCFGNKILRDGFVLDFIFWLVAYGILYSTSLIYQRLKNTKLIS